MPSCGRCVYSRDETFVLSLSQRGTSLMLLTLVLQHWALAQLGRGLLSMGGATHRMTMYARDSSLPEHNPIRVYAGARYSPGVIASFASDVNGRLI